MKKYDDVMIRMVLAGMMCLLSVCPCRAAQPDEPSGAAAQPLLTGVQSPQGDFDPQDLDTFLSQDHIPDEIRAMFEAERRTQAGQPAEVVPDPVEAQTRAGDAPPRSADGPVKPAGNPPTAGSVIETAMIDSLEMKDMEITDVLNLLSQKSGLNIVAGKNVSGTVSIYLKDVRLKDALRIILDSNGLAYREEDGILLVMSAQEYEKRYGHVFGGKVTTRIVHMDYASVKDALSVLDQVKSSAGKILTDEKSNTLILMDTAEKLSMMTDLIMEIDVPVEIRVFGLNYSQAKDTAEKIEPFLTDGLGTVKYDERSNKVIVSDTAEKLSKVARMIEAFDVREQQVLIEARIVQIELSDNYELGVDWQAIFAGIDDLNVQSDFNVIDAGSANMGSLAIGTIANNNYSATLEALRQIGDTNILSSPSITALNNQEAKILVGSNQPYVTTSTTTSSGIATTAETINFIDVGVQLYVTPTIHPDGFITLQIRPEVSSVLDYLETSGDNSIPIVKTSQAETTVRIKDGVGIVIGGLIEDSTADTRNKVPVLGDIPLLGMAFRNRNTSLGKTEIAIFLTPRIISGDQEVVTDFTSPHETRKAFE